ncbi:hypothetical protein [Aquimarina algiphila]|uniref:hypothetical protein n=1 Tax=Aquimarina algiphila TaxID=2047982 RepID=UPI00232BD44C|nr:hypothetical protein [Aquimarina algiphila]
MNRITKRKSRILLSIGMFAIASTQIISQYIGISDLTRGSLTGIGIGMLLIGLIFGNFRSAYSN